MILCLLVACKSFTQNDTISKPKYVFLTEDQARANIKELLAYDALKLISAKQEERIQNFQEIIGTFERVVANKDSIISEKDEIIGLQEKIIKTKKPIKFHSYVGMESFGLDFKTPAFYVRSVFEFRKLNLGVRGNARPVQSYNLPYVDFNIYVEYKIF